MRHLKNISKSTHLSFKGQISPLTFLVRYKKNNAWSTISMHFATSSKNPLADVNFGMKYVESYLENNNISYDGIVRVSQNLIDHFC